MRMDINYLLKDVDPADHFLIQNLAARMELLTRSARKVVK